MDPLFVLPSPLPDIHDFGGTEDSSPFSRTILIGWLPQTFSPAEEKVTG
jgi:hypothetical protein